MSGAYRRAKSSRCCLSMKHCTLTITAHRSHLCTRECPSARLLPDPGIASILMNAKTHFLWEYIPMSTIQDYASQTRIKGSMLQANHIRLSYGPRLVLDDVSFTVAPGEKAGLIGVNGAGKSSLLKIIAGLLDADGGTVMLPRTYGYLSQDVAHESFVAEGGTVRNFIFNSIGLDAVIEAYEELTNKVAEAADGDLPALLQRFEQVQD